MLIDKIIKETSLLKLLDLIREFCREVALGNNDEQCIRLKETVENAEGNDYLTLLSSYLSICDTEDEVIEALEEFVDNCKDFAENAIKTNDHKVFKRFMQEMCDDQMHYFDDNIEKWYELYLELDKENLNNIENIWGEGFALYKTYIDVSVRFSDEYLKYIEHNKRFQDRHDGEMLFTALRYINGRAIQVANEILVLLKNGYADAAYARRRTLYELSIVADFLVKYGDDVAKAYIEYDGQWCDWAKNVIPKKGRITFSRFNIKERMKVIPIGPSPEGIVTAAVNSIESLYHMNCMYFGWEKDVFALVFMTVLNGLKQKVFENLMH